MSRLGMLRPAACLLAGVAGPAGAAWATDVRVRVMGVDDRGGDMVVSICTKATFMKDCPHHGHAPATAGTSEVLVRDVAPGTYAVLVFHDINRNGEVDRTLLGIPEEGVGFSHNPMLVLRAPTFEETAVTVGGTLVEVDITLKFEP